MSSVGAGLTTTGQTLDRLPKLYSGGRLPRSSTDLGSSANSSLASLNAVSTSVTSSFHQRCAQRMERDENVQDPPCPRGICHQLVVQGWTGSNGPTYPASPACTRIVVDLIWNKTCASSLILIRGIKTAESEGGRSRGLVCVCAGAAVSGKAGNGSSTFWTAARSVRVNECRALCDLYKHRRRRQVDTERRGGIFVMHVVCYRWSLLSKRTMV
jgi:hypothetical protein